DGPAVLVSAGFEVVARGEAYVDMGLGGAAGGVRGYARVHQVRRRHAVLGQDGRARARTVGLVRKDAASLVQPAEARRDRDARRVGRLVVEPAGVLDLGVPIDGPHRAGVDVD